MMSILSNSRRHDLTFYKSGRIDISSRVAKMVSLHDGDVMDIGIDNGEYYFFVRYRSENVVGRHEACCHKIRNNKNTNCFRTYSKTITDAVRKIVNVDDDEPLRISAGAEAEEKDVGRCVPLITRRLH